MTGVPKMLLVAGTACAAGCSSGAPRTPHAADTAAQAAARTTAPAAESALALGSIGPGTSEAELVRRFGAAAVVHEDVPIGEGETEPGTTLFPGDSLRRVSILWQDPATRTRPASVHLSGERSRWRIGPELGLGTDLATAERLNGRPFSLAGFGWDYSGTVTSWEGGALDSLVTPGRVLLRFAPPASAEAAARGLMGDREFRSDDPRMRRVNPRVYAIVVDYTHR